VMEFAQTAASLTDADDDSSQELPAEEFLCLGDLYDVHNRTSNRSLAPREIRMKNSTHQLLSVAGGSMFSEDRQYPREA
jgi:hypothetical protein